MNQGYSMKKKETLAKIIEGIYTLKVTNVDDLEIITGIKKSSLYLHLRFLVACKYICQKKVILGLKGANSIYYIGKWRLELAEIVEEKYLKIAT